jgi:hypothetical protein
MSNSFNIKPVTNVLHLKIQKITSLLLEIDQYKEEILTYSKLLDDEFKRLPEMTNEQSALWKQYRLIEFIDKWEPVYNRLSKIKVFL